MDAFGDPFGVNPHSSDSKQCCSYSVPGDATKRFPPTDLLERFFNIKEASAGEVKAECNLCASRGNRSLITGDSTTKLPFREHVKVCPSSPSMKAMILLIVFSPQQLHGLSYIEYLEDYISMGLEDADGKVSQRIFPKTLHTAVSNYIIKEHLPVSTIENESFRKLIKGKPDSSSL